jgi:hypothetical protein
MGQYFQVVCLNRHATQHEITNNKFEWCSPTSAGQTSELMSHAYIGNPFMNTIMGLLSPSKVYHKKRLVWIGERAEDVAPIHGISATLYKDRLDTDNFYERKSFGESLLNDDDDLRWLVNWTKRECVDMHKLIVFGADNIVHPLALLCAYGNGDNAGDYHDLRDTMVGSWAGDVISVELVKNTNMFREIFPKFTEQEMIEIDEQIFPVSVTPSTGSLSIQQITFTK